MQLAADVRAYNEDEQDPGKPRPVQNERRRRTTSIESADIDPWSRVRKDNDRDHHRHVC
jgi:hypothetical protein